MDDPVPQGVNLLRYCDKCNKLIKPGAGEGIKSGEKRFCIECAAALPAARPSQRNIKPARPSDAGLKAAPRDSRRLPVASPVAPEPVSEHTRSKALLFAAGIGFILICTLALWLALRSEGEDGGSDQKPLPAQIAAQPDASRSVPPPVPKPTRSPVPPPAKAGPPLPPTVGGNPPLPPVALPGPIPAVQEKRTDKPTGPTPEERLATFKKDLESATALIAKESYTAAGELLRKMQDDASTMPWWKEQESRWSETHGKLKQLVQEGREEADGACAEAEKAATPAALEAIESQWRQRRASAPAGELGAEWAKKVLDAVATARRAQRARLREKLAAQVEEKLPALEKSIPSTARPTEALQRAFAEVEATAAQDTTLVDRYGERLAALRWMVDTAQEEELALYRANVRKMGAVCEVGFDFSSREQLEAWELDDPEKHGRWQLLTPGPGLLLETKHQHEWWGKDRRNTPVLRVPFLIRSERWVAEVDAEMVSKTGDKPYQACLMVWEGGQNYMALVVEDAGGTKGWQPHLLGCTPNREAVFSKVAPLPARAGESVRLQMAGMGDTLTCAVRFRGAMVQVAKERLGFQPKYLGLMVRTNGDMTAVANFRDLKLIGVPDTEKLKSLRENRKPAELKQIVSELHTRSRMAERVAEGKSFPLPLGDVANVACSSRLKDGRSDDERLILPRWGLLAVGGIPFQVADPQGTTVKNAILLKGDGVVPAKMPETVKVPCGRAAGSIHLIGGVSVGGFPGGEKGSLTLTLRIRYQDGQTEEHAFKNGLHFADYARLVDVPLSRVAFRSQGHQVRCISVAPKRPDAVIKELEFVKGTDSCAPLILAVTLDPRLPLPELYNLGFKDQPVAAGRLGKALDCDGVRKFQLPHRDELEPDEFTLEAWLKMEQYPGNGRRWIVSKNVNETRPGHYGLLIDNERVMGYINSDKIHEPRGGKLELNRWEHIAMTVSRDQMVLYLNGDRVAEESLGQPRPKDNGVFAIGVRPDDFTPFRGLIDEVRVYSRVIPPDEMKLHAGDPENSPREGLIAYWSFDEE